MVTHVSPLFENSSNWATLGTNQSVLNTGVATFQDCMPLSKELWSIVQNLWLTYIAAKLVASKALLGEMLVSVAQPYRLWDR